MFLLFFFGFLYSWPGDGYCDAVCNNPENDFDGGDCGTMPPTMPPTKSPTKSPTTHLAPTPSPTPAPTERVLPAFDQGAFDAAMKDAVVTAEISTVTAAPTPAPTPSPTYAGFEAVEEHVLLDGQLRRLVLRRGCACNAWLL